MPTASAATVSISPATVLQSGQQRSLGAAWGDTGPYNVNFQCGAPGCANFVTSSTTQTSLGRSYYFSTCSPTIHYHTITVRESSGARASGASQTTWKAGPCK